MTVTTSPPDKAQAEATAPHDPVIAALAPVIVLSGVGLAVFTLTRLVLAAATGLQDLPPESWAGIFERGFFADLATISVLAGLWLVYEVVLPNRLRRMWLHSLARGAWALAAAFAFLFGAVSEFTFWSEFTSRMNFIAVDYLIYTHEVVGNILESYPVGLIVAVVTLLAAVTAWPILRSYRRNDAVDRNLPVRLGLLTAAIVLIGTGGVLFDKDWLRGSGNEIVDELAQNGLYTFAAALRSNEIDYDRFYATIRQDTADAILGERGVRRPRVADPGVAPAAPETLVGPVLQAATATVPSIWRDPPLVFRKPPRHVVLVSIESLSAQFLGVHGSKLGLTPRLDALSREGVHFARMFATGTRTVRGLEALSLGLPPIPGQSIVRRPANDDLALFGNLLARQGFDSLFLYGGYGYFDNMSAYFGANRHQVVDRTAIPKERISFENAWGVADEVLYAQAIESIDEKVRSGARVFAHVMTTSNHRPYTYPDGRIDIPSPGGRNGAVKYTDWALGELIDQARKKPWFDDTLFVFVADHCSSVAGKIKLPVGDYHIAALLYAPKLLEPRRYESIVSQIDLPPTLLEALGVQGADQFFGTSLVSAERAPNRAFISNYQHLGLLRGSVLTILSPKREIETYRVDIGSSRFKSRAIGFDAARAQETIAFYQTAARAFKQGALKAAEPAPRR